MESQSPEAQLFKLGQVACIWQKRKSIWQPFIVRKEANTGSKHGCQLAKHLPRSLGKNTAEIWTDNGIAGDCQTQNYH